MYIYIERERETRTHTHTHKGKFLTRQLSTYSGEPGRREVYAWIQKRVESGKEALDGRSLELQYRECGIGGNKYNKEHQTSIGTYFGFFCRLNVDA